jgi:hypothetical protein
MEKFKVKNKLKFFTKNVFPKKGFKVFSGLDIIKMYERNLSELKHTNIKDHIHKIYDRQWHKKDVRLLGDGVIKPLVEIHYREDYKYYVNTSKDTSNWISLEPRKGWEEKSSFGAVLNSEHYIRGIKNTFLYVYTVIPGEFITKYMTRIIADADYQKFVHAMKEYKSTKITSLIKLYEKYDKFYDDEFEEIKGDGSVKKNNKWRRDLFFYMTFTLKKLGYFNPILETNISKVFFDGSHRLGVGPAVGLDVPMFIRASNSNIFDNTVWVTSCGYFNNKSILLGIDMNNNATKGYWISDNDMDKYFRINNDKDRIPVLNSSYNVQDIVERYIDLDPDFLFHE